MSHGSGREGSREKTGHTVSSCGQEHSRMPCSEECEASAPRQGRVQRGRPSSSRLSLTYPTRRLRPHLVIAGDPPPPQSGSVGKPRRCLSFAQRRGKASLSAALSAPPPPIDAQTRHTKNDRSRLRRLLPATSWACPRYQPWHQATNVVIQRQPPFLACLWGEGGKAHGPARPTALSYHDGLGFCVKAVSGRIVRDRAVGVRAAARRALYQEEAGSRPEGRGVPVGGYGLRERNPERWGARFAPYASTTASRHRHFAIARV